MSKTRKTSHLCYSARLINTEIVPALYFVFGVVNFLLVYGEVGYGVQCHFYCSFKHHNKGDYGGIVFHAR